MANLLSSNAMKALFRVHKLFFILLLVLILLSISIYYRISDEGWTHLSLLPNNYRLIIDRNSKSDIQIDNERRALRLIETFNLIEENANLPSLTNCNIGIKIK